MKKLVALIAALVLALFPTVVNAVDSPSQGCPADSITNYSNNTVAEKVRAQIDSAYVYVRGYDITCEGADSAKVAADLSDASDVLVVHVLDEASAKWERVACTWTSSTVTIELPDSLSPFLIYKKIANDTKGGGTSGGSGSGTNPSVLPNTDVQ